MKLLNKLLIFLPILIFFNSYPNDQLIDKNKFVDNPKIILIDIGGTLITTNVFKFTKYFGFRDLLGCIFGSIFKRDLFIFNMTNFYLEMLTKIPSTFKAPDYSTKGINGKTMPSLQRDSFLGKISLKDCIDIGNKWIEQNRHQFKNEYQLNFFKKILHFNFDVETFIKYQKYTPTIELLKKLYSVCDENGKRKNICIILSTQPKEIIPLLKKSFPDIFKYSDSQVFSCYEGYIKPHSRLFEKCISYCPDSSFKTCFFIDDEKENIEASKKLNINGYSIIGLYPNESEKFLQKFGVI